MGSTKRYMLRTTTPPAPAPEPAAARAETPAPAPASGARRALSAQTAREAFILAELLAPPLARRRARGRRFI